MRPPYSRARLRFLTLPILVLCTLALPAPSALASEGTISGGVSSSWQTNATVWSLAYGGGVVYVGGEFTSVRPPGAALGTGEVPRTKLAAFDAATGDLLPFAPVIDGTVKALAVSPDGTRLYAGGGFLSVDGVKRLRSAAFDIATGTLISDFHPSANSKVATIAISADSSTVYLGGSFTTVASQPRLSLAAVGADGALLPWAASTDGTVYGMTIAPGGGRLVVGGTFDHINGTSYHAIGSVDPATGATQSWSAKVVPTCSVVKAVINDGTNIYVGAEGTGGGCFDGTFAAEPVNGALVWQDNCLGATQSLAVIDDDLYVGSHAHNCSAVPGGFPEVPTGGAHHLMAESIVNGWLGHWWPNTSGNPLGPRTMATDGSQLFLGGDFKTVNKKPQQGFARFGPVDMTRPNKPAPPTGTSVRIGQLVVTWTAVTDLDDGLLTYRLYRDGGTTPIYTVAARSTEWSKPALTFTDTGLTPGESHTYRLDVTDGSNVSYKSSPSLAVTVTATNLPYADVVKADAPFLYWRFGESSGNTASDATGNGRTGTYKNPGFTLGQPGAISGDVDTAVALDGSKGFVYANSSIAGQQTFSVEAWFKTTTTKGGKIVGFGSSQNGTSGTYDRHLYMTNAGGLIFGVYPGAVRTVQSGGPYNDGEWHHVVGTLGGGLNLYVDGALVASDATVVSAQSYTGYWRVGNDNLSGWPSLPTSQYFGGTVDEVAIYPSALTAAQVANHNAAGRGL